ncbi:hypothetical protein [Lunatibacter salilacus]|uniref:hypothetical protein n=1 Tax=Lunatibacter salilacus TaxID=2483804 RepID=UPI00131E07FA|nr:hypothetical protein [Lunatibacter salilacus]
MLERKAPTLLLFEQQLDAGKTLFGELAKKIRSKKAIHLEEKLFFYQLFLELIGKIHFEEKKLSLKLFSSFDQLYRNLKLVHHVRIINDLYESQRINLNEPLTDYKQDLDEDKKRVYTELFDTILSAPIKIWEDLYLSVYPFVRELTPFQVNTATTQIINEEVDFSHFDAKNELDPISIKDIYEGLNKIIAIENIRTSMGLNPIFTDAVHKKINLLSRQLYDWYQNHLFFQHFSHFLREKETVDKKHLQLLKTIKKNHKRLTTDVATQSVYLFTQVLH